MSLKTVAVEYSSSHSDRRGQQLEWAGNGAILTVDSSRIFYHVTAIKIDSLWYMPETGRSYNSNVVRLAFPKFTIFHHHKQPPWGDG